MSKLWSGNVWVCVNNNALRGKKQQQRNTTYFKVACKDIWKLVGRFCSSLIFVSIMWNHTFRHKEANSYFYRMIKAPKISTFMMHLLSSSAQIAAYFKYNCVSQSESQSALGNVSLGPSPTGSQSKYCQHLPGRAGSVSATSPQFKLY